MPIAPTEKASSLEITITQTKSDEAPKEADFFAQANQEGSGTTQEKQALTTDVESEFDDNVIRKIQPKPTLAASRFEKQKTESAVIVTKAPSPHKAAEFTPDQEVSQKREMMSDTVDQLQRNLEMASLAAQLKQKQNAYAKRPRKRQLTAVSAKEARDARYLDDWRRKVERVGNRYYPREAKRRKIYGHLRLMVAVKSDGTIYEIHVRQPSGFKVLDDAAIAIVRRAAPFAPFPEEISQDTDILEIIRTWKFEPGDLLSSE